MGKLNFVKEVSDLLLDDDTALQFAQAISSSVPTLNADGFALSANDGVRPLSDLGPVGRVQEGLQKLGPSDGRLIRNTA